MRTKIFNLGYYNKCCRISCIILVKSLQQIYTLSLTIKLLISVFHLRIKHLLLEMKKVIALSLPYISFFSTLLRIKNIFVCTKKLCDVFSEGDSKILFKTFNGYRYRKNSFQERNLYVYLTPLLCNFCRGRSLNKSIIWGQLFSELSYHKSLNSTQAFSLQIYSEKNVSTKRIKV